VAPEGSEATSCFSFATSARTGIEPRPPWDRDFSSARAYPALCQAPLRGRTAYRGFVRATGDRGCRFTHSIPASGSRASLQTRSRRSSGRVRNMLRDRPARRGGGRGAAQRQRCPSEHRAVQWDRVAEEKGQRRPAAGRASSPGTTATPARPARAASAAAAPPRSSRRAGAGGISRSPWGPPPLGFDAQCVRRHRGSPARPAPRPAGAASGRGSLGAR
jgi:hypothetical protein